MRRLMLATCPALPDLFHDDVPLVEAFARRGVEAVPQPWQSIEPDATPVLIRTPWDYTEHRAAFALWLDRLESAGTQVLNPIRLVRWNIGKTYLKEIEARGHAIVPTEVLPAFDADAVRAISERHGWAEAVAKPTVGAGATGLVVVGRQDAIRTFDAGGNTWMPGASALPSGPCLVQPLVPEIAEGEWSLFYCGGTYSHAVLKLPAEGDIRIQEEHGGTSVPAAPAPPVRAAADGIMADVPGAVYGRVDGVVVNGRFLLMELELIEPEMYFRYAPGSVDRFADAVAGALR